jgi:acyl-CoA thioesterase-1
MRSAAFSFLCGFLMAGLLPACGGDAPSEPDAEAERDAASDAPAAKDDRSTILFLGDSLTAGYGVEPEHAYPSLLQERIDAEERPYRVVNAAVSGETTSDALARLEWHRAAEGAGAGPHVRVIVLALGGNDGLRGVPASVVEENLQTLVHAARAAFPEVRILLAGMQSPPNMGDEYTRAFRDAFRKVAQANDVAFLPFLLEGVGGEPDMNLRDGIHPNEAGHRRVADNVWAVLEPLL